MRRHALFVVVFGVMVCPIVAWKLQSRAAAGDASVPTPAVAPAPAGVDSQFTTTLLPFVKGNCLSCHSTAKAKGDLNLEILNTPASLSKDRLSWDKVLDKLRTGEMPPKKATTRPSREEATAMVALLKGELTALDKLIPPNAGRVTMRRLNRNEYNNTVRDLLGVDLHPADSFPPDDTGYGFDNNGDVLSLSPVLMERYLDAAELVVHTAIYGAEQLKSTRSRYEHPDPQPRDDSSIPKKYDETGVTSIAAQNFIHRFPVDGTYVFKSGLRNSRPFGSDPVHLGIWIDGKMLGEATVVPAMEGEASLFPGTQDFTGRMSEQPERVPAGDHWVTISILRLYEGLPEKFNGPNPTKTKPASSRMAALNRLVLDFTEIVGPYNQESSGPRPETLKKIFGDIDPKNPPAGCEKQILANFAGKAFRRPATTEEVARYIKIYEMVRKLGDSFEEGISNAIQGVLVSPAFLFRGEKDRAAANPDGSYSIDDFELASRLSYFLWSSMPDDQLFDAAREGALRKPEVLKAQIERMLKDPRSIALVDNFGGQWLQFKSMIGVKPDQVKYPAWNDNIRFSMRRETEAFFQYIVQEDRPILDFLNADYTFLNESLAKFYGIPGVVGTEFRKVDLAGTKHGGVLTQGSVLTVTSYPTRTSPVLRGKWVLENILNAPPPPPPPDVPNLDVANVGKDVSLRQQLEEHRKNSACATCHARMDPLGFSLENFDGIGGWREKDGKLPIDPSGTLPDGREFKGAGEMKTILTADKDIFAECLTDKLLTYALGRGLEKYDRQTVQAISAKIAESDYKFSSLVFEITKSLPFQNRKGPGVKP